MSQHMRSTLKWFGLCALAAIVAGFVAGFFHLPRNVDTLICVVIITGMVVFHRVRRRGSRDRHHLPGAQCVGRTVDYVKKTT